ncbi:MAG: DEAD/DEAH box helicase [Cyanobacteria bacterium P01_F01_bin.53]
MFSNRYREFSDNDGRTIKHPCVMPPSTFSQQQAPQDTYRQLTAVQQSIVQVFALLYTPASRDRAYACWLQALCLENPLFEDLGRKAFSQQITELITQGILTQAKNQGPRCAIQLMEIALRDAVLTDNFEPLAQIIETALPVRKHYQSSTRDFRDPEEFMRSLRIAIYREDSEEIDALFEETHYISWQADILFFDVLKSILTNPFDSDWMSQLSEAFFEMGMSAILGQAIEQCEPAPETFELLEEIAIEDEILGAEMMLLYAEQLWIRGFITEANQILTLVGDYDDLEDYVHQAYALKGAMQLLLGNTRGAITQYHLGLEAAGNTPEEQAAWFTLPATALFFLALLADNSPSAQQELTQHAFLLQCRPNHWLHQSASLLLNVLHMQQGHSSQVLEATEQLKFYRIQSVGIPAMMESLCLHWLGIKTLPQWLPLGLAKHCQRALQAGYDWLAAEIANLLIHYQRNDEPKSAYQEVVTAIREQTHTIPLLDMVQTQAPWELSLKGLAQLTEPEPQDTTPVKAAPFRMAWRLRFASSAFWSLTPLEQKIGARGTWTKGKPIALKRLVDEYEIPDYATEHDQSICDTIQVEYEQNNYYYRASTPIYSFTPATLLALVGHPLVFLEDSPNVRVDIVAGEIELIVKRLEGGDRLSLSLSPPLDDSELLFLKETPTRIKVIEITADHHRIAAFLGDNNRLEVPANAEEQVLKAIAGVASLVTVQSDIGGGVEAEPVESDATPRVHLLPAGEGLKVSLLSYPFAIGGAYYRPGEGGETVIAVVEGKRLQTQRDLAAEKANAQQVKAACPVLTEIPEVNGEWILEDTSDCLDLLLQLQALGEAVVLEWPEGEKFKVSRELSLDDFRIDIRQQQDWFAASGEVQISENQVMDMQQLMALLEKSPGQFVALADGEFLALTEEFRQRLNMLGRLSQPHGKGLRIHGLAALALDDMLDDMEQLKVDQAWKEHIHHIKAACEIEPKVPNTLQAQLRDYQLAGYTWLARLANWGVGACLADDMGLGKTLQGLAIVLNRCDEGPTLVIAPTSVCMNWASETERFAQSLRVKDFGSESREHRQAMLDGLGPKDLVVCSYGLVQQAEEADMLQGVKWQNIVLDEAQAIKNHATKRSQAVMALQASFKIIMTGTPIENHLGELWNLFRFINPGLLGSLESFNERFANPIERDKDEGASETLRKLIQPFILRRTKDQVLKELPSRTEITLSVELSKEEMAFYEALRREALENLANSEAQAGQRHLQVLAEIMKLRRACCHPSLVRPELELSSTKLQQFSDLLTELLENGHKALVFSQFVDHLKILRKHLEAQQIHYQYLDGSTSRKKRKQAVDAFQSGEGDVFLISLKAGGSGLNLTAADYVLHMDPWWNPAVEDQASDRAHRIGQQRPVTIYRLVAKGTIEDKIVALHKLKRDLADSLLTGSDASGKVSTEQLLSLIQQ